MLKSVNGILDQFKLRNCAVCGKPVVGQCRVDKWGQLFHNECEFRPCINCGRVVSLNDTLLPYNRQVCSHCIDKVVRTDAHIEWVYDRVQDIFNNNFLSLPGRVPVEIVSADKMLSLYSQRGMSQIPSGLTRSGGSGFFGAKMTHKVYMLDYLHKIVFGGVLAHELLHVWQNEHHTTLPPAYSEGFCNLGTYLFYNFLDNELSRIHIEQMMKSPDPIYGEGFREVKHIFETEGGRNLEKTIEILQAKSKRRKSIF
ncbi:MAG: hypothetical protein IIX42_01720 [Alistipes sp.]|nr:hypothetical protein [Alistipes sp.]